MRANAVLTQSAGEFDHDLSVYPSVRPSFRLLAIAFVRTLFAAGNIFHCGVHVSFRSLTEAERKDDH